MPLSVHHQTLLTRIRAITMGSWHEAISGLRLALDTSTIPPKVLAAIHKVLGGLQPPHAYFDETAQATLIEAYDWQHPDIARLNAARLQLVTTRSTVAQLISEEAHQAWMALVACYDDFILQIAAEDRQVRADVFAPALTLHGPDLALHRIHPETARQVASMTHYGERARQNETGNHDVTPVGELHCKSDVGTGIRIQPEREYAAATLIQLFTEQLIVAPSTVVKLSNLPYQHIPSTEEDPSQNSEAYAAFMSRRNTATIDTILKSDPGLAPQLKQQTRYQNRLIQVSYTIQGISLYEVLMLQKLFQHAQENLFYGCLSNFVNSIINDTLPFFEMGEIAINSEAQDKTFDDHLDADLFLRAKLYRCYKKIFTSISQNDVDIAYNKFGKDYLIKTLGLVQFYPSLSVDISFDEFIDYIKMFSHIVTKVFPSKNIDAICEQTPKLLNFLDEEALSALLIGLMVSLPNDARFDNLIYTIDAYSEDGFIKLARLVAFDNDESLTLPFVSIRSRITATTRNALVFLDELMQKHLDIKVYELIVKQGALALTMRWLTLLGERQQAYRALFEAGTFDHHDINSEDENESILIPLQLHADIISYVYRLMQKLEAYLKSKHPMKIKHADIFSHLFPGIDALHIHIKEKKQQLTRTPLDVTAIQEVFQSAACFTVIAGKTIPTYETWEAFLPTHTHWSKLSCKIITEEEALSLKTLQESHKLRPLHDGIAKFINGLDETSLLYETGNDMRMLRELLSYYPGVTIHPDSPLLPMAQALKLRVITPPAASISRADTSTGTLLQVSRRVLTEPRYLPESSHQLFSSLHGPAPSSSSAGSHLRRPRTFSQLHQPHASKPGFFDHSQSSPDIARASTTRAPQRQRAFSEFELVNAILGMGSQ